MREEMDASALHGLDNKTTVTSRLITHEKKDLRQRQAANLLLLGTMYCDMHKKSNVSSSTLISV